MKFSSIYPNFEEDLLREVSLLKVALRTIQLRVNHQLTQEEFAEKLENQIENCFNSYYD